MSEEGAYRPARLCWEVLVHEVTAVSFHIIRNNAIQNRTRSSQFYPPYTAPQDFLVYKTVKIVVTQGSWDFALVLVVTDRESITLSAQRQPTTAVNFANRMCFRTANIVRATQDLLVVKEVGL